MTRLHALALGSVFAIAACSSERTVLQNTDEDGNGDGDIVESATCPELYAHVDGCYSDAGCSGLFVEDNFVSSCEDIGFTGKELGQQVSQSCDDTIFFFCDLATQGAQNPGLFSSDCCKAVFSCPAELVCEPLDRSDNEAGVCVTASSSFPPGAPSCSGPGACAQGFICVQGATSSKCVQVCVP